MSSSAVQYTLTGQVATLPQAIVSTEPTSNYSYITHSAVPSLISAFLIVAIALMLPLK